MTMLKKGMISVPQAARLGCVSRQAVHGWVTKAGWDMQQRSDAFAAREFARLMGTNIGRVKSKAELRRDADEASQAWEWRHGQDGLEPGER